MADAHLKHTFDLAAKTHPDLMEPYVILLADAEAGDEQDSVMRRGLRETIGRRFPLPGPELRE
jgi:hypothetical protein